MTDVELATDIWTLRLCQLCATVLALYDHAITLDREVEMIWKKRWSLSKALFLYNRYMGDFILIAEACLFVSTTKLTDHACFSALKVQAWLSASVVWCMQAILVMRIFAMYNASRRILIFIGTCFIIEVAALVLLKLKFAATQVSTEPVPGVHLCSPSDVPSLFWSFWIPIIAFESMLAAFPLRNGITHLREVFTRSSAHERALSEVLLNVIVRDSLVYFLVITCAYLVTAIMWATLPPIWIEVPEGFSGALTCIMGSRLILNMREAYYHPMSTIGGVSSFRTPNFTHVEAGVETNSEPPPAIRLSQIPARALREDADRTWEPMRFSANDSLEALEREQKGRASRRDAVA